MLLEPPILVRDGQSAPAPELLEVPTAEDWLGGNAGDAVRIAPDADLDALAPRLSALRQILVEFPAFTDGRGFSLARQLRKQMGYAGELVAYGHLIPDQHAFALQCGFSAVAVAQADFARHTESAWHDAVGAFPYAYQRGYTLDRGTRNSGPAAAVPDLRHPDAPHAREGQGTNDPFDYLSAEDAIRRAVELYGDGLGLVSSFGADSAVLLHLVSRIKPDMPVYFLDTGRHFPETLEYRDQLAERLGLTNVITLHPEDVEVEAEDPRTDLSTLNPDACCDLRKVRPLKATQHLAARITGRKRYQTPDRADMTIFESDPEQDKVNPLAHWSAKDVTRYIREHDLPPHPLLAKGYLSIGCAPCTTIVDAGEDPRAGRWRNADKVECGIHLVDGKWERTETEKAYEVF